MKKLLTLGVLGLLGCAGGFAATVDVILALQNDGSLNISLNPSGGVLTGTVGSTVGWGFNLTAGDTYGLVVNASYFCPGPTVSGCYAGYGDLIGITNSIGINPGDFPNPQPFDGSGQGFGSFVVQNIPTAGYLILDYTLIDSGGLPTQQQPEGPAAIAAEVDPVTDTNTAPEPATWMLMGLGAAAVGVWKRRTAN